MDSLKRRCKETFERWDFDIKESSDGVKRINIAKEVEKLLSQNIIMIAFGEDINDEKIRLDCTTELMGTKFEARDLTLGEAVHECM